MSSYNQDALRESLPELPWERRERYLSIGIKPDDADLYVRDTRLGTFFDEVSDTYVAKPEIVLLASNYIVNDLVKIIRDIEIRDGISLESMPISVHFFLKIIQMLSTKRISSRAGKDLLLESVRDSKDPEVLAQEKNLFQNNSTGDLAIMVAEIIAKNQTVALEYKKGKVSLLEFFVGQGMKASRGTADPEVLRELLKSALSE